MQSQHIGSVTMAVQDAVASLDADAACFSACIASLPEDLYLAPIGAWTPRDVLAYLIG